MNELIRLVFERTVDRGAMVNLMPDFQSSVGRVNATAWRNFEAGEIIVRGITLDPATHDRLTVRTVLGTHGLSRDKASMVYDQIELNELYLGELVEPDGDK